MWKELLAHKNDKSLLSDFNLITNYQPPNKKIIPQIGKKSKLLGSCLDTITDIERREQTYIAKYENH